MAVLAINISEKGRNSLGMALLLLNLSVALIGFMIIIIASIMGMFFYRQRDMLTDFSYSKLTSFITFSGISLAIFHCFGAKLGFDWGNINTRDHLKKFMLPFQRLLFAPLLLLIILSITTSSVIYQLSKGYEKGFRELMEVYDSDLSKKMEIDLLQVRNKCCGSKSYK